MINIFFLSLLFCAVRQHSKYGCMKVCLGNQRERERERERERDN